MRTKNLIATAASAALLAGAAFAQSAAPDANMSPPAATGDTSVNPAPNDPGSSMPAPAATTPSPGASDTTTVAPAASAPAERTSADAAANADVVSNGPVPDTKENRAKYGKPMSNAGRMTKPAGN